MRSFSSSLGDWGETVAAEHLQTGGWTIIERKFRAGHKEIDLVARRGEVVAFIEVKTRSSDQFGHPFDAVGPRKQGDIEKAAESWIVEHGEGILTYRFDVISIHPGPNGIAAIEHLEDAWGI